MIRTTPKTITYITQAMTNGQYPSGLLGHQGLQHSPATPVIRTMDMSNTNNRTMEMNNSGGTTYHQLASNSPSPRDGNSPPGLVVPNGHASGSHSSKVPTIKHWFQCNVYPASPPGPLPGWLSSLPLTACSPASGDEAGSAPAGRTYLKLKSKLNLNSNWL